MALPTWRFGPIKTPPGASPELAGVVRQLNQRFDLIERYIRSIVGEARAPDKLDKTLVDIT